MVVANKSVCKLSGQLPDELTSSFLDVILDVCCFLGSLAGKLFKVLTFPFFSVPR